MPDPSNNVATKKDLSDLKEDLLQRLVSNEEFDQKIATLATKEELDQKIAPLATRASLEVVANQVAKNTDDIEMIKYDIKGLRLEMGQMREEMNDKFNTLLNVADTIVKELQDHRTEKTFIDHALLRHEDRLDKHDHRIEKLEEAVYV